VVQLWKRDRATILRGWNTLRLNIRLNIYASRQYLWTARWTSSLKVFTERNFVKL